MGNAFPWSTDGLTFRSRGELEKVIERFAGAGTGRISAFFIA